MSTRLDLPTSPEPAHFAGFSEAPVQPLTGYPLLAAKWEEARAEAQAGKVVQLQPRDLGFWTERFSIEEIDELIIPKRTLARRKARKEALTVEETGKALRLARVIAEADRVFGDAAKSDRWLRRPNPVLRGIRPLAMLRSETGSLAVHELLGQIDHGMFI